MGMLSRFVEGIDGHIILSVISLLLFFAVFIGAIIWVLRLDKNYRSKMKNFPIEEDKKD